MPDRFGQYLDETAAQVRWRAARPALTRELSDHLAGQKAAYLAGGMAEEDAEAEALRQMGDPVLVGQALDLAHRPRPQWGLLALTLALFLAGTLLRLYLRTGFFWADAVAEQLPRFTAAVLVSLAALFGGYFLDISFVGKHAGKLYLGAIAVSLFLLWRSARVAGVPYYLGQFTAVYPVVYALAVYALRGRGRAGYFLSLLAGVPLAMLCLLAVDPPALVVLLTTGAVLLLLCARRDWFRIGARWPRYLTAVLAALCAGCILYVLWYTGALQTALRPERAPHGAGFMGLSVRELVSASRWWGAGAEVEPPRGLVISLSADLFPLNILYQLGRGPMLLLGMALVALLVWTTTKALRQENALGRIVSLAVVLTLGQQLLWSLLSNLGFLLFETPMPLVTGLINSALDMGLLGLMLSAFRCEALPEAEPRSARRLGTPRSRVHFDGGLITIDLRPRT